MITEAYLFAAQAHAGQTRKGGLPYIVHPVAVAVELAKNGADDALICAGLLHDTMEDAGVTEGELARRFTPEIAALIAMDSEDKSLPWEARKADMLRRVRASDNRAFLMLRCADKLCNLRDMARGVAVEGEAFWAHFKRGRDVQAALARDMTAALAPLGDLAMYRELQSAAAAVFGGAE